jgi:hypothetical protein
MSIGLGLQWRGGGGTSLPTDAASTIAYADPVGDGSDVHFAAANDVFDVQAVDGLSGADIPVIVNAAADGEVYARVVDSAGAVIKDVTDLGSGTGAEAVYTLSGVPLHPTGDDLTLQVLAGSTWQDAPRTFRTGYTIALFSQSEGAYLFEGTASETYTLTGNGSVKVYDLNTSGGSLIHDTNSGGNVPVGLKSWLEALNALAPNAHWKIACHTQAGTSPVDLVGNTNTASREWADETDLRDLAFSHEAQASVTPLPGLVTWLWWHSTDFLGANFANDMSPFFTGALLDGTAFNSASGGTVGSVSYAANRTLNDLYGTNGEGRICFTDHREIDGPTAYRQSRAWNTDLGNEFQRKSVYDFLDNHATTFTSDIYGVAAQSYQNQGAADSYVHPSTAADGAGRFAKQVALQLAYQFGLASFTVPEFTVDSLTSTTLTLDTTQGGAITTERLAAAGSRPTGVDSYASEVQFIEVDGTPCVGADVSSGKVEITLPRAYGYEVNGASNIAFASGAGLLKVPDDHTAELWRDYPQVTDTSATAVGLEGIDVRPRTFMIASSGSSVSTVTGWESPGPAESNIRWFRDLTAGAMSEATFLVDYRALNTGTLFSFGNLGFAVQHQSAGRATLVLNNGGGIASSGVIVADGENPAGNDFLSPGQRQVLLFSAKFTTTTFAAHVWRNGVHVYSRTGSNTNAANVSFRDSAARGWTVFGQFNATTLLAGQFYGFRLAYGAGTYIDPAVPADDRTFDPAYWDVSVVGDNAAALASPFVLGTSTGADFT